MNHPTRHLPVVCTLLLLAAAPPAQGTMADQYARQQDFSTSPPSFDSTLAHMMWYLEPNQSYEHSGGPPFPSPGPWFLPANLWSYYGHCKSGRSETGTSPRCVTTWSEYFILFVFTDGSQWSFEDTRQATVCSDNSSETFRKVYQVAQLGPPGARDSLVWVQSWAQDTLEVHRRYLRGRAGAVASFQAQGGVPVVSGDPLAIELAPGAILDLRQNAAAAGPIFVTDGPALLRCDTILLDPGVTPADLFAPPPIVQPGAIVAEVAVPPRSFAGARGSPTFAVATAVSNLGNAPLQAQLSWAGPVCTPGSITVTLPMGARQPVTIPCAFPPGTPVGATGTLQLQATTVGGPFATTNGEVRLAHQHAGVFRFGTGSPGCLGSHTTDLDGPLALGGPPRQFVVTANNPFGIGLWLLGESVGGNYGTLAPPGLADLHVDPFTAFANVLYLADAAGAGTLPLQVPADPALRALQFAAQPVGLWLGPCQPGVLTFSSGPALGVQVQ